MKLIGTYERRVTDEELNLEVTFSMKDYNYKKFCEDLEKGETYALDVKKMKSKRSLNQNNYFWKLLDEIEKKQNGHKADSWSLYLQLLEMADVKSTYLQVLEEALDIVKTNFRAYKIIEKRIVNGKDTVMVKVWNGQSNFDKEEMGKLIDTALDYAEEVGVADLTFYKEVLK